jgi:hypothetical protein
MTPRRISWALTIVGMGALAWWWLLASADYVMWFGLALFMVAIIIEGTWPRNRTKS